MTTTLRPLSFRCDAGMTLAALISMLKLMPEEVMDALVSVEGTKKIVGVRLFISGGQEYDQPSGVVLDTEYD